MTIQNGVHAPMGSACLEKVLGRLDKVKAAGSGSPTAHREAETAKAHRG